MRRSIDLDLVPVSALAAEAGNRCPFTDCPTGVMRPDHRGLLVCTDCEYAAADVVELVAATLAQVRS